MDLTNIDREIIVQLLKNHGYKLIQHEPTDVLIAAVFKGLARGEMKEEEIIALIQKNSRHP